MFLRCAVFISLLLLAPAYAFNCKGEISGEFSSELRLPGLKMHLVREGLEPEQFVYELEANRALIVSRKGVRRYLIAHYREKDVVPTFQEDLTPDFNYKAFIEALGRWYGIEEGATEDQVYQAAKTVDRFLVIRIDRRVAYRMTSDMRKLVNFVSRLHLTKLLVLFRYEAETTFVELLKRQGIPEH